MVQQGHLLDAIYALAEKIGLDDIDCIEELAELTPGSNHRVSKLSFLSEGGGKTRVIAIGDYWSQEVLKPLHEALMRILKKLETDGTYAQNLQADRIIRLAGNEAESIDLSSATDRFPFELQKILIATLWGQDFSESWETIMTKRDFSVNDRHVRYSTGQPMGFYSSWPAFALTHHALIEYCAFQKGYQSFRQYAVLGDDVVI